MKKIIKYIIITFVLLVSFSLNAKAYDYISQSIDGETIYCIDGDYPKSRDFNSCEYIPIQNSDALDALFKTYGANNINIQMALRQVADNSGLTQKLKESGVEAINNESIRKVVGWDTKIVLSKGRVTFDLVGSKDGVATIKVTTPVAADIYNGNTKIGSVQAGGGNVSVNYTLKGKCKGAVLELKAVATETSIISEPGNNTDGTNGYYFIDCGAGIQSYIGKLSKIPGTDGIDGDGTNRKVKNSNVIGRRKLTIPDPECECKGGTTGLCTECNESGETSTAHDNLDNLLACAENDAFTEYCGLSLKKTTDVNNSETNITEHSGKVTPNSKLSSNHYCSVYCVEKIEYEMPGFIKTKGGRYFELRKAWDISDSKTYKNDTVSVKGTRTCFTTEIDNESYRNDVRNQEENVIAAWNNYHEEKARKEAVANATPSNVSSTDSKGNACQYTLMKTSKVKYDHFSGYTIDSQGTFKGGSTSKEEYYKEWISDTGNCDNVVKGVEPSEIGFTDYDAQIQIMNEIINEFKSCSEWTNNYCFEPKAKFSYDEPYNADIQGELPVDKKEEPHLIEKGYYNSLSNEDSYIGAGESIPSNSNSSTNYVYATESSIVPQTVFINSDIKYVKKVMEDKVTFKEATKEISTYHPYGTISPTSKCTDKEHCENLGYKIPVALEHEKDINNYYIEFENIGVGGDDAVCENKGRINGCNSSLTKTENKNCTTDYSCKYSVTDCPECKVTCKCPDGSDNCTEKKDDETNTVICYWEFPENCPECQVSCIGCLWDTGDTTISYKTISLDDVYQDDEKQTSSNWTEEKIKQIESRGQEIYNYEPQYRFTLTPSVMQDIREYNRDSITGSNNVPKGGYSSDTLTCKDGKNCKSSFIDKIKEKTDALLPKDR